MKIVEDKNKFYLNKSLRNIKGEVWKDVKWKSSGKIYNYTGMYMVSNFGRIKNMERKGSVYNNTTLGIFPQKIITQSFDQTGYLMVGLRKNGYSRTKRVHILVGLMFIDNPKNKPTINHKKGIKTDNRATELEWATRKEQMKHCFANGFSGGVVVNKEFKKLTDKQVMQIFLSKKSGVQLSKKYPVSRSVISAIKTGKIWNSVTGLKSTRVRK